MGWNDRMDDPEAYGAQYGRDYYSSASRRSIAIDGADSNDAEEEE